ncbi:sensor histidine kinase [Cohnella cellulosilytica]|uniref:Histidine kinase n=1 Tax=Cohnella cellulosilytica TaxID=986710 RepID=A0ABW2FMF6_9BACL
MRNSLAFQKKLFLQYSIVAMLIVSCSVIAFYQYIVKTTEADAMRNLEQLAVKTSDQVDSLFQGMDQIALQMMSNPQIIQTMGRIKRDPDEGNYFEKDPRTTADFGKLLAAINGPNVSASRVSVYNLQGDYASTGILEETSDQIHAFLRSDELAAIYGQVDPLKGRKLLLPPHEDFWSANGQQRIVSLVRLIKNLTTGENFALVEVQQPYAKLADILDFQRLGSVQAYLLAADGRMMAATARAEDGADWERALAGLQGQRPGEAFETSLPLPGGEGGQKVAVVVPSEFTEQRLILIQSRDELFASKRTALQIVLLSGLSLVLVTLAITFLLSRNLTKPLVQLRRSLQDVTLNNLSIELDPGGNKNEFVLLNRAFDAMFRRLNESVGQEIKAHFLAMQSQMNPHFLFNMLAVIGSTAEEAGNDKVTEMCGKLSRMLRYASSYATAETTLKDEFEHTVNYLELMKERYENYFSYRIEADEASSAVKVPKLILQPIVENCFQHAFASVDPPWFIGIAVRSDETGWTIEVADNGSGFAPRAIEELELKIQDTIGNLPAGIEGMGFGGLGLVNTIVRLKLMYKSDFQYRILANEPRGAIIRIGGAIK